MNSTSSFLYNVVDWIAKFAFLNVLWIAFSLLGAVVLGVFPATAALFAVIRQWLKGNAGMPVFATFWRYYRQEFIKSNLLGLFVWLMLVLIGLDVLYIQAAGGDLAWTHIPLFAFMLLVVLFLFYLFPVFVHYDIPNSQVVKNAFLLMLVNPLTSIMIIFCLVPLFIIMRAFPATAFIFGASSYAFITMWLCLNTFNKANERAAS
ncbi:YesL family protein [Planococcus lenghuensis]|uniref:DUF624 domain-containing protein n=1 Tax=Planococcus lenghuensis TaxID=2213202 RepID=A0A1Q2KW62_9BACL|nr:DUF624 domain-containing protein [Planococcus lenghuensis]AQQ52383.1 hypothetical protein B0X71_04140 [Planococcus lenghuensis]